VPRLASCLCIVAALGVSACGGGDQYVAEHNAVFYAYDTLGTRSTTDYERPYPPLDLKAQRSSPDYVGVEVLNGNVRISRPTSWVIRAASNEPGRRFIQYVSPNEYLVGIYERPEMPDALWGPVLERYEQDLATAKAEVVQKGVPMATWNTQGRAYLVRRKVPAAKGPFVSLSREYIARADRRIVLVQIVHPTVGLAAVSAELLRVVNTLELR
jgi:hypothetical protein